MATAADSSQQLSNCIVEFSLENRFPEDIAQLPPVSETNLRPALNALAKAKEEIEAELHTINEETREDVSAWVRNAKTLQEDIIRSKTIANDIVRQSEAPDVSGEAIQDAEEKAEFMNREVQYSQQLHGVLRGIQHVNMLLSEVEAAKNERRILDSLHLLEKSWTALDNLGVSKTCRVMKLLNLRSFELKSGVHEVFNHVWKSLLNVDVETGKVAIYQSLPDEQMTLSEAVIGLQAYKELDERMEQLWRNVDAAVVNPRMDSKRDPLPGVSAEGDILQLKGQADRSIEALLADLETTLGYLAQKLPLDLLPALCSFMMTDIIPKLISVWLNSAVPSSLKEMIRFQTMVEKARGFCERIEDMGYTGFKELQDWVDNAPSIWLNKCRETTLDAVRTELLKGIGESKRVEKIEKRMVSFEEGKELTKTSGAGGAAEASTDWGADWGDAWEDNQQGVAQEEPSSNANEANAPATGEDDGADAWGWGDDAVEEPKEQATKPEEDEEDDAAAAWGWGDEDAVLEPEPQPQPTIVSSKPAKETHGGTRELVLKETYNISSMPQPVLELIQAILEDGAALTAENSEYSPLASTAPGLFNLPTFVLALFRAIAPYYYSLDIGGNMFLYNDVMYLAERLSEFSQLWNKREDLTVRARNMLRLENDIKSLQDFANRSYLSEMNTQKTVLRDLLGGAESIMQQDDTEACIDAGTARVRSMAITWEPILARSVWSQAIGALADTLAQKLIADVLDMLSIGQDEAYNIAQLIAKATELDNLFLPNRLSGNPTPWTKDEDGVPTTAQYAPNWLRLKFLSEVLQSNLNEVKYLWCESELSLYFTVGEVVDLIQASFEANSRTKDAIREIQAKPRPVE